MIPYSVLDLCPIVEGGTAADAFTHSLDLARHTERLGYNRFWLAEHHNMPGIASAATSVVIAHIAGGTKTIRVGSGGIMLPNHSPLVIAEQFGTLASLFPNRIDLGLGRAPGTDMIAARALRRDSLNTSDRFPEDVVELQAFFEPVKTGQVLRAVPGAGLSIPIWILGSSLFGAHLAAELGLPFAFASHFAPADLVPAFEIYRRKFKSSTQLEQPYTMACISVFAADTDEEARRLFTSMQQAFINLRRGNPGKLRPPIDDIDAYCNPLEKSLIDQALTYAIVGSPHSVRKGLEAFVHNIQPDELMITSNIYDHTARLRSFAITADVRD